MPTHAKLKLAITVPAAMVQRLENPHKLRAWLADQGLWPAGVYDARYRIDPLSQGTVVELELWVAVGAKE